MQLHIANQSGPHNTNSLLPQLITEEDFPGKFGSIPLRCPSNLDIQPPSSSLQRPLDVPHSRQHNGVAQPCLPTNWRPESNPVNLETSSGWQPTMSGGEECLREQETRKRAASREFLRPYLKEMVHAHAENREPRREIPV